MDLTIIGAGSMGMALAKGLEKRYKIEFVVRDRLKHKNLEDKYRIYNLKNFDISNRDILLAIKPHAILDVKRKLKGEANSLYSVLAGTSIETLKSNLKAKYYIRAMPNISARFGKSTTILTGDEVIKDEALKLFALVGDVFWVDSQKEIDIATAVAGSGPALLALVAEAMADGLVKEGLKRKDATDITASLFNGFSPLIKSQHPALIKDSVMSPAGTTARAYYILEKRGVRGAFIKAVEEAYNILKQKGR
jgi:pyrroline-5-carboxylate reductase